MSLNILNIRNLKEDSDFIKNSNLEKFYTLQESNLKKNNLCFDTNKSNFSYPLSLNTWNQKEYNAINEVVYSNTFTMGKKVREFERKFSSYIGSKYAVMVNSGSSANLLMIASLILDKNINLNEGDEVIVPSLSWATTYYPLSQYKLKMRFVDINLDTLNIDENKIINAITKKTRAIIAVNVLGNPCNFKKLKEICKKNNLLLLEDNCEALGAKYNDKFCGTHGEVGTFSFYYSHHIHTIEGGMIVTDNKDIYHSLLSLRSHGWIRDLPKDNKLFKKKNNEFEESFAFVLPGYNLRPSEINGSVGIEQLKKLNKIIKQRRKNASIFQNFFKDSEKVKIQKEIQFSSWFGFSLILDGCLKNKRNHVLRKMSDSNIETRPIISGNFLKYPVTKYFNYSVCGKLKNSESIDSRGFFVGNNHVDLEHQIATLHKIISSL